jgi:hypothetical protein
MAFSKDYFDKTTQRYTQHIEEPLYEDDAEATTTKGGMIRLFEFDVKLKKHRTIRLSLDPIT